SAPLPATRVAPTIALPCPPNSVAAAALPGCSSFASTTVASSGNVVSRGAVAQTSLNNSQVSGAVTGGGTAPVVVQNTSSAEVDDVGSALGQTGLANAQGAALGTVGSPTTGSASPGSSATSGDATASGLSAQNSVTNSALAGVVVAGANHASVTVSSQNQVTVSDVGSSSATSGAALANRAATSAPSASARRPTSAFASATMPGLVRVSAPVSSTGLNAVNAAQGALATTSTARPTGPLTVAHTSGVTMSNVGSASGTTASACSGFGCDLPAASLTNRGLGGATAPLPSPGASQANSGAASAQGLAAQNVVNTQAKVSVQVNGANYGIINVVIQTITSIVNWGTASAQSGDASAVAANSAAPSIAASPLVPLNATTGSVQVTGASVSNQVGLSSSVSITTPGDNDNPIVVLVRLLANLANRGTSQAFSGTAQSFGQSPGTNAAPTGATSGSVAATGLQAQNQVDLSSDVSINIGGSNYAPIDVYVVLGTQIDNQGQALAVSGDARASAGTAAASPALAASTSSASGIASPALSAPATVGQSSDAANTGLASAASGSGAASGVVSAISVANAQIGGVSSPGLSRAALNSASYLFNTRGLASLTTGSSSSGPLPVGSATGRATVPSPATPRQVGGTSGRGAGGSSGTIVANPGQGASVAPSLPNPSNLLPGRDGSPSPVVSLGRDLARLGLWSVLPDPDATLMPGQAARRSSRAPRVQAAAPTATVSTSAIELQLMPELVPDAPPQSLAARAAATAPNASVRAAPLAAPITRSSPTASTAPLTREAPVNVTLILALVLAALVGLGTVAWRRRVPVAQLARSALGSISLW
ncbi:MAG: beta strand repeat-containing protein, partial [Chloroflexota bacterium]